MDNYIYFLVYVRMTASNSNVLKTIKSNPRRQIKKDSVAAHGWVTHGAIITLPISKL